VTIVLKTTSCHYYFYPSIFQFKKNPVLILFENLLSIVIGIISNVLRRTFTLFNSTVKARLCSL